MIILMKSGGIVKDSGEHSRLMVTFSGRVQGVGFRMTAADIAQRCNVTGFVRNESDGSVYLEAEGPKRNLEALLAQVYASHLGGLIREAHPRWSEPTGQYTLFDIRYS